jgi:hypothetical protein
MNDHKCITSAELEKWESLSKEEKQLLANKGTGKCVYCRRLWMKFLAERK